MNIEELLAMESKNLYISDSSGRREYETTVENGTIIRFSIVCLKTVDGEIESLTKEKKVLEERLNIIDIRISELKKVKETLPIQEVIEEKVEEEESIEDEVIIENK